MKKFFAFMLVCLLMLSGCTGDTGTDEKNIITSPPELTVLCGSEETEAMLGTYSWESYAGNDTYRSVEACGSHPLESVDLLTLLESYDAQLKLSFAIQPDKVEVLCWDAEKADGAQSQKAQYEDGVLQLQQGLYVYQISAHYESSDLWGGTAYYIIYALAT